MDLSTLSTTAASDEGATMALLHPTTFEPMANDKGDPCLIKLLGRDSKKFRDNVRTKANQRLNQKKAPKKDYDDYENDGLALLASLTVSFINIEYNGKPAKASDASEIYRELPWVKEQVDEFVNDRANFIGGVLTA